jgi:hypothetical protein
MLPTLVAAAGDPNISAKLKERLTVGKQPSRVYVDGFNIVAP